MAVEVTFKIVAPSVPFENTAKIGEDVPIVSSAFGAYAVDVPITIAPLEAMLNLLELFVSKLTKLPLNPIEAFAPKNVPDIFPF